MFELEAVLQLDATNRFTDYPVALFSVDSRDLLPGSRYILPNWNPSCFRLVNIRFLQFAL